MTAIGTALGEALFRQHAGPVFALAGSGNFSILETFKQLGGRYVGANHESGAVTMANGWAQVAGAPGIASVHQGPGFTNALTSLIDSAKERTSLVFIVAEVPEEKSQHHQYLPQRDVLAALDTELVEIRLGNSDVPGDVLAEALRIARSGPAVVVISVPITILYDAAPEPGGVGKTRTIEATPPQQADVDRVAQMLSDAAHPVIAVGRGARSAESAIAALAERIGVPIVTSLAGDGLFEGSSQLVGFIGGFAGQHTLDVILDADVVVGFGTSFDSWSTIGGTLLAHADKVVSVALAAPVNDRAEWIEADAAGFAGALLESDLGERADRAHPLRTIDEPAGSEDFTHPRELFRRLNEMLPTPRTIALDSGQFMAWAGMFLRAQRDGRYFVGQGFQSVGLGLARGIGAAVADPGRTTLVVCGDGGFYMGLADLETAAREHVPLLIVVVNDSGYGAEVHDFGPHGYTTEVAQFPLRNIAAAAAGIGVASEVITSYGELERQLAKLPLDAPLVLDCRVDKTINAADSMTEAGARHWSK